MPNYSITLNFLIPQIIVEGLKEIVTPKKISFDWRETEYCHCTVKSISLCNKLPSKNVIVDWKSTIQKTLISQNMFDVKIQDISYFPTALFAHVVSDELIILHNKLCEALPASQPQFEKGNYIPHVSLCQLDSIVGQTLVTERAFGKFIVDELQVVIWDLNKLSKPEIVYRFSLTN